MGKEEEKENHYTYKMRLFQPILTVLKYVDRGLFHSTVSEPLKGLYPSKDFVCRDLRPPGRQRI